MEENKELKIRFENLSLPLKMAIFGGMCTFIAYTIIIFIVIIGMFYV